MKIITATQTEPANEIIKRAGIVTTGVKWNEQFWTYNGITVPRPSVNKWEKECFRIFGIKIKYVNG